MAHHHDREEAMTSVPLIDLLREEYIDPRARVRCCCVYLPSAVLCEWAGRIADEAVAAYALPSEELEEWALGWLSGEDRSARSAVIAGKRAWVWAALSEAAEDAACTAEAAAMIVACATAPRRQAQRAWAIRLVASAANAVAGATGACSGSATEADMYAQIDDALRLLKAREGGKE